ncbi:FadR/GntR family transcriptional regulator [Mycolicibacterium hodleri]|uniref:FadR family transcriptional regulator n=1 Tax=Mycolicibacterium hodleri TaxID=49897 RepID=A0A502EGJ1_9MYCO|nr:FCD domain-containing protein [Mycolicibacterium hodleri]TPG36567.1 FadR family transcriptional regulator [Mycolicibacterium hodleri]
MTGPTVPKAAEVAVATLRRRIILGLLAEGDALPSEDDLLVELGVSKPTLRQAIRILESESLVTVRRGAHGGIQVSVPRVETAAGYAATVLEYRGATTADLFEAAVALEGPCAAMLARRRTPEQLEQLRKAATPDTGVVDSRLLLQRENDFHRVVIELAGNATLQVLCAIVREIIDAATSRYLTGTRSEVHGPAVAAGARAHSRFVDLVASRDAEEAEALWGRHIRATAARVRDAGGADRVIDIFG